MDPLNSSPREKKCTNYILTREIGRMQQFSWLIIEILEHIN